MDYWEDWQKVYQHGIMVIWPPDEIRKIVNAQRRAFDPESAAVCETHITLTQPLLNPLNDSERKQIQEIVDSPVVGLCHQRFRLAVTIDVTL